MRIYSTKELKKKKIKLVWGCPFGHQHRFLWVAWICCHLANKFKTKVGRK